MIPLSCTSNLASRRLNRYYVTKLFWLHCDICKELTKMIKSSQCFKTVSLLCSNTGYIHITKMYISFCWFELIKSRIWNLQRTEKCIVVTKFKWFNFQNDTANLECHCPFRLRFPHNHLKLRHIWVVDLS